MKDPLGVSPSKGNQGTTRGKEKFLLTSVGIEPTTSGLDLPLLCRLSYEVGQRKSGTIKVVNRSEERVRIYSCFDKGCPTKALKRTRQCRLVLWVERVWR